MTALIAIDGELEPENRAGYEQYYRGSFMQQLVAGWSKGTAVYARGPNGSIRSSAHAANRILPQALEIARGGHGMILAGYSRGGAAAIVLAQLLGRQGIPVHCLALFDAVDLDWTVGTGISSNVALTVHGHRSPDSYSRPRWPNCGLTSPNRLYRQGVKITHWGASGVPPVFTRPGAKLTEVVESGMIRETNVTYQEELAGMQRLWSWIKMHIDGGPKLQLPVPDELYTVVQGDSLSLIAGRAWKDVLLWPILYDANKDIVGRNPNYLRIGLVLAIPSIDRLTEAELNAMRARGRNWRAA
jgi:hypothetical protein